MKKLLLLASLSACVAPAWAQVPALPAAVRVFAAGGFSSVVRDFRAGVEALRRSKGLKPGNEPFLLSHGRRTRRAAVLVHGLSDSPLRMRALGEALHRRGLNVVGILLTGHGTKPSDLSEATGKAWRRNVADGLEVAEALGEEVVLVGYSAGGALVLDAAASAPPSVTHLALLAPALRIKSWAARNFCALPGLRHTWGFASKAPETADAYGNIHAVGVCELNDLARSNASRSREQRAALAARGTSVFVANTLADATVDPAAVSEFARATGARLLEFPASEGVVHAELPREGTAHFKRLAGALAEFAAD